MGYKIDEHEIVNWAINKLPDILCFDKKLAIVYVNDYIGETKVIRENRFSEIYLPNGELVLLDKKEKIYCYYVIFRKIKEEDKWLWDLVGYDKREVISFNVC